MQEELNDHLVDVSSPSISIVNLSALRGQQIMVERRAFLLVNGGICQASLVRREVTAACIWTEETGQQGMLSRCYKVSHERS